MSEEVDRSARERWTEAHSIALPDPTKFPLWKRWLRKLVNWIVERFFPGMAFFSHGYLDVFRARDEEMMKRGSYIGPSAANYLIRYVSKARGEKLTVELGGYTHGDTPMGDWVLTVEQVRKPEASE